MLIRPQARPPATVDELVGPELLRRIERLDVLSRRTLAGKLPGERRSKRRGRSVEFDDYRPYTPGDDLRHLDWNVLARFERFVIKLFRADEDLSVRVVFDASASMDTGEPSKRLVCARLAYILASIALAANNRVSLACFGRPGTTGLVSLAPLRGTTSRARLSAFVLDQLQPAETGSPTPSMGFNDAMRRVALDRLAGKGVVILVSDFLFPDGWQRGLDDLAANRGFETVCLQVLTPEELDPKLAVEAGLRGDLRLTDAESGRGAEVTVTGPLIGEYERRLKSHLDALAQGCRARGMQHLLVRTDADLASVVLNTLRKRGVVG